MVPLVLTHSHMSHMLKTCWAFRGNVFDDLLATCDCQLTQTSALGLWPSQVIRSLGAGGGFWVLEQFAFRFPGENCRARKHVSTTSNKGGFSSHTSKAACSFQESRMWDHEKHVRQHLQDLPFKSKTATPPSRGLCLALSCYISEWPRETWKYKSPCATMLFIRFLLKMGGWNQKKDG